MSGAISESMTHEFRLLRNRIEVQTPAPALVFVTSATARDGASLAAYGLAQSLSATSERTVLVTTDPTVAADASFEVVVVSAERIATISRSSAATFVQQLRAEHAFVVVDAGNLPKNSLGLLLVASADIALIAFRSGRAQEPADRSMLETLERAKAKVLGAVLTDEPAIARFERRDDRVTVTSGVREPQSGSLTANRLQIALSRRGKSN
jgi:Mrp family chromosome partitioning ATPase